MDRLSHIALRTPKRVMSTTFGNELAVEINGKPLNGTSGDLGASAGSPEFIGRIVASGPNNESDFPDERYWVEANFIAAGQPTDRLTFNADTTSTNPDDSGAPPAHPRVYCVTNLAESNGNPGSGGHVLTIGQPVYAWGEPDAGDPDSDTPSLWHYVTSVGGSLPRPQYENMYPQAGAQLTYIASYGHGFMMNPAP